eukprot:UN24422
MRCEVLRHEKLKTPLTINTLWSVNSVRLSPDANLCVFGCGIGDRCVRLWDMRKNALERCYFKCETSVASVDVSESGRTILAVALDGKVYLYDRRVNEVQQTWNIPKPDIWSSGYTDNPCS